MSFFAEQLFEPRDVDIHIDGVGQLQFPLSGEVLEKLLHLAQPAHYGRREDTLLDQKVRDTAEIGSELLRVSFAQSALQQAMLGLAEQLELEADALEAPELHNLLVYGKGQFFKPHQDTEKIPGMVATWVMVLPTPHIGGHLEVKHGGQTHSLCSENINETQIRCLGFYADCEHEVRPVKEGYRLALTFMIALKPQASQMPRRGGPVNERLLLQVRQHFEQVDEAPGMFVHYLDHQYTQRGLGWGKLKGTDRKLAQDLSAVAQALNLSTHLALAQIQQTWTCWDEDEEPDELIEEGISLDYWLDNDGKERPYGSQYAPPHTLHWHNETGEEHLESREYEGYMGNYGNTMDYWYRRAAVVLWRASDQAKFEFKFNPAGAWQRIKELVQRPGHESQVEQLMVSANAAHWSNQANHMTEYLPLALEAAAYIGQPALAKATLQAVELHMLDSRCTKGLVALLKHYGKPWLNARFDEWLAQAAKQPAWRAPTWPPLDDLVEAAKRANLDEDVLSMLAQHHVMSLVAFDQRHTQDTPQQIQTDEPERINRLKNVLGGLCKMHSVDLGQSLSHHVLSHLHLYPLVSIVDMTLDVAAANTDGLPVAEELMRGLKQALDKRLAEPPRAADDWSLQLKGRCACAHCTTALAFASSHSDRQKIWPLAQQGRDHLMQQGQAQLWPLKFEVLKQGSPHKLVITKPPRLHQAQAQEMAEMQSRLQQLKQIDQICAESIRPTA